MRNKETNDTDANNSNGGDSYGELKAENIHLKDQLKMCSILSEVFVHYLCVHGADNWFKREDLVNIHHTYLSAHGGITG